MEKADYISNGYGYRTDEQGRVIQVYGELRLVDDFQRDGKAQREAGDAARQPRDEGGHYIGARFGGSPGPENLFAQNQTFNRSDYKRMENSWARDLQRGNRVFVNIESSYPDVQNRPVALFGTYTVVRPDGSTFTDHFSFTNENMHTGDLVEDIGGLEDAPVSQLPTGVTQADLEASLKYDQGRVFQKNDPNALNVTMAEEFQELSQPRAEAQCKSSVSSLSAGEDVTQFSEASSAFIASVEAVSGQETEGGSQGSEASSAFIASVEAVSGQETEGGSQGSEASSAFIASVEAVSGQETEGGSQGSEASSAFIASVEAVSGQETEGGSQGSEASSAFIASVEAVSGQETEGGSQGSEASSAFIASVEAVSGQETEGGSQGSEASSAFIASVEAVSGQETEGENQGSEASSAFIASVEAVSGQETEGGSQGSEASSAFTASVEAVSGQETEGESQGSGQGIEP